MFVSTLLALVAAPAPFHALHGPNPATVAIHLDDAYEEDVAWALDALEEKCGRFFKLKGIDWKAVKKEFTKSAKKVDDVQGDRAPAERTHRADDQRWIGLAV